MTELNKLKKRELVELLVDIDHQKNMLEEEVKTLKTQLNSVSLEDPKIKYLRKRLICVLDLRKRRMYENHLQKLIY